MPYLDEMLKSSRHVDVEDIFYPGQMLLVGDIVQLSNRKCYSFKSMNRWVKTESRTTFPDEIDQELTSQDLNLFGISKKQISDSSSSSSMMDHKDEFESQKRFVLIDVQDDNEEEQQTDVKKARTKEPTRMSGRLDLHRHPNRNRLYHPYSR